MRHVTRFEVGGILRCGLALYLRHLPAIGLLTVVLCAPGVLFYSPIVYSSLLPTPYPLSSGVMEDGFEILVVLVFDSTLLGASLAYFTVRALRFGAPSVGQTIVHALRCFPLVFVVVFVVMPAVLLGFVAFVVPGIMALAAFFVVVEVAAVERQKVGATLRRSLALTRGHRWPIFGLLLVLFAPWMVVEIALGFARPRFALVFVEWAKALSEVFFTSIWSVVTAVAYHDLRVLKDGRDARTVAEVFA